MFSPRRGEEGEIDGERSNNYGQGGKVSWNYSRNIWQNRINLPIETSDKSQRVR